MPPKVTLVALVLTLAACSGESTDLLLPGVVPEALDCNVPITTVVQEVNGGQTPRLELIATQDDWCALWAEIYPPGPSRPACDTTSIDFSWQAALVAATTGPTTCSGIAITCVHRDADDNLTVAYRASGDPPPGVLCSPMFVNPVHVVRFDLPAGLVTFVPDTSTP